MKIGFLITARLKSKRLPLKLIKKIKGKTVIEWVIERTKQIRGISKIVLCTSPYLQDKPLVDIARKNNINCFSQKLKHEEDVIELLLRAAKLFNLDYFLGITGENALFSIDYSNKIVEQIKKDGPDFIKIEGLPFGAATFGVKTKVFELVYQVKPITDTEIWGPLVDRTELFKIQTIKARGKLKRPKLALSIDYKEDYQLFKKIYANVPFKKLIKLSDAIDYLDKNPDVAKMVSNCKRFSLDPEITKQKEIDKYYLKNLEKIKKIKSKIFKD